MHFWKFANFQSLVRVDASFLLSWMLVNSTPGLCSKNGYLNIQLKDVMLTVHFHAKHCNIMMKINHQNNILCVFYDIHKFTHWEAYSSLSRVTFSLWHDVINVRVYFTKGSFFLHISAVLPILNNCMIMMYFWWRRW